MTGFVRRRSDQPTPADAASDGAGDPAGAGSGAPSGTGARAGTTGRTGGVGGGEDQLQLRLGLTLLAALAGWTALHAVLTPLVASGQAMTMTIAVDVLAAASLTAAVLLARHPDPWTLTLPLALAPALAAGRGLAADQPLLGLDAGIALIGAALVLPRLHLMMVSTAALGAWAAAAGYGMVRHLVNGSLQGEPTWRAVGSWAYAAVLVTGAAGLAHVVQRMATHRVAPRAAASPDEQGAADEPGHGPARDPLTGLANRIGVELVAQPMIEHARRSGQAVHCLYIDVDGMRAVNEAAGLAGGDSVLRDVAAVVHGCVRGTDVVCRWNGDQFVVLGPGTGMSPLELERRVRARLITKPPVPIEIWNGRVSIGSATLVPWDDGDLGALVARGEVDMQMRRSLRRQSRERLAGPLGPASGDNTEGTLQG